MDAKAKPRKKKAVLPRSGEGRFAMVIKPLGDVPGSKSVQFGGVTVVVPTPSREVVRDHIKKSKKVATRMSKVVSSPGVRLKASSDTPMFTADPRDPTVVIRRLGGEMSRGRFSNGKFVKIA